MAIQNVMAITDATSRSGKEGGPQSEGGPHECQASPWLGRRLNDTFAFEPEHGVAVAVSHIVAAIRVLRVADPDLLLNHVLELSDALRSIDDFVIQTAELQQARRKYALEKAWDLAT